MKAKDMIKIIQKHERNYYTDMVIFEREYNTLVREGRLRTSYGLFIQEHCLISSRKWETIYNLMKELEIESEEE